METNWDLVEAADQGVVVFLARCMWMWAIIVIIILNRIVTGGSGVGRKYLRLFRILRVFVSLSCYCSRFSHLLSRMQITWRDSEIKTDNKMKKKRSFDLNVINFEFLWHHFAFVSSVEYTNVHAEPITMTRRLRDPVRLITKNSDMNLHTKSKLKKKPQTENRRK